MRATVSTKTRSSHLSASSDQVSVPVSVLSVRVVGLSLKLLLQLSPAAAPPMSVAARPAFNLPPGPALGGGGGVGT